MSTKAFLTKLPFGPVTIASTKGKHVCAVCMKNNHADVEAGEENEPIPKFVDSDATFKCPARHCSAKKLSYREFYVGSCCYEALNREILDGRCTF